jgi:hypothetical protein
LAAKVDLHRALIVPTRDVQIYDCDLQNPAIEITYFAGFRIPGILQGFMCLEIFARIEQAESIHSTWVERSVAEAI